MKSLNLVHCGLVLSSCQTQTMEKCFVNTGKKSKKNPQWGALLFKEALKVSKYPRF